MLTAQNLTIEERTKEVVRLAQAMIDGEIDLVEGCRDIVYFTKRTPLEDDPVIDLFFEFDDVTDHFPVGPARQHWSAEILAKKDAEKTEALKELGEPILNACQKALDKFS